MLHSAYTELLLLLLPLLTPTRSQVSSYVGKVEEELNVYSRAGSNSIDVSWDAITGADSYLVSWDPSATDGVNSTTTSDLQYDIINLESCTAYMVTVEALNETTFIVQDTDAAVTTPLTPSSVQNLQVTQEGCVLSVVWDVPGMNTGNCLLSYLVNWDINGQPGGQNTTTDTSYNITDLVTNATYTVSVAATTGGFSSPAERRDTTTDILGAPQDLTVEASQDSLQVTWQQPQQPCYKITAYRVSWQSEDGSEAGTVDLNSTTTEYTILDLSPCVDYFVSVSVVSGEVPGTPATTSATTGAVAPNPVRDLRVDSLTSTQLYVTWTPPEEVGTCGPLTYNISWEDVVTGVGDSDTSTTTHYTIRFLTAGTNYSVCVSATAGADYGPPQCVYRMTDNPCQTPYRSVGGRCLFFDPLEKGPWELVKGFCKGLLGDLVKINTSDLLTSIVLFVQEIGVETNYWIGGRDEGQTGEWVWQDGSSVRMGTPFWGYDYVSGCQMPYCADTGYCAAMGPSHFYYFLGLDCAVEASPICEFQGQQ